jgi:hypothetical protein
VRDVIKYGAAVVVYIALTLVTKKHLNWIVGPLFLVTLFDVIPRTVRAVTRRRSPSDEPASELA